MAQTNPNAAVRASSGLGPRTDILSVDDVTSVTVEAACLEAQNEGFIVAGVEALTSGSHIALQGAGATPSITGCTLVATFLNS